MHYLVIFLGYYMLLMGLLGWFRTGSIAPIFISGSLAVVTIVLGFYIRRKKVPVIVATILWVGFNFILNSYMAIFRVQAHTPVRAYSEYIFGSVAFFCLVTVIALIWWLWVRVEKPDTDTF